MIDGLTQHGAVLVPAALALVTGTAAALSLSASAVRRGLRADLEIITTAAPTHGRAALADTIEPRLFELSARVIHPLVTVNDLVRVAVLVTGAAAVVAYGGARFAESAEVPGWELVASCLAFAVGLLVLWSITVKAWYRRMGRRTALLRQAPAHPEPWAFPWAASVVAWWLIGVAFVPVPLLAALADSPRFDAWETALTVVIVGLLVVLAWSTINAARRAIRAATSSARRHAGGGKRRAA